MELGVGCSNDKEVMHHMALIRTMYLFEPYAVPVQSHPGAECLWSGEVELCRRRMQCATVSKTVGTMHKSHKRDRTIFARMFVG